METPKTHYYATITPAKPSPAVARIAYLTPNLDLIWLNDQNTGQHLDHIDDLEGICYGIKAKIVILKNFDIEASWKVQNYGEYTGYKWQTGNNLRYIVDTRYVCPNELESNISKVALALAELQKKMLAAFGVDLFARPTPAMLSSYIYRLKYAKNRDRQPVPKHVRDMALKSLNSAAYGYAARPGVHYGRFEVWDAKNYYAQIVNSIPGLPINWVEHGADKTDSFPVFREGYIERVHSPIGPAGRHSYLLGRGITRPKEYTVVTEYNTTMAIAEHTLGYVINYEALEEARAKGESTSLKNYLNHLCVMRNNASHHPIQSRILKMMITGIIGKLSQITQDNSPSECYSPEWHAIITSLARAKITELAYAADAYHVMVDALIIDAYKMPFNRYEWTVSEMGSVLKIAGRNLWVLMDWEGRIIESAAQGLGAENIHLLAAWNGQPVTHDIVMGGIKRTVTFGVGL